MIGLFDVYDALMIGLFNVSDSLMIGLFDVSDGLMIGLCGRCWLGGFVWQQCSLVRFVVLVTIAYILISPYPSYQYTDTRQPLHEPCPQLQQSLSE